MDQIVFYRAPYGEVLGEWLWIALWIYVGMRIERRRARKQREAVEEALRIEAIRRNGGDREPRFD